MFEELKCLIHGANQETVCSWCGESICSQCIESSDYKNYCPKCYTKISKNSVAGIINRRLRGEKITNVDSSLTKEELKKRRDMVELRMKTIKVFGE